LKPPGVLPMNNINISKNEIENNFDLGLVTDIRPYGFKQIVTTEQGFYLLQPIRFSSQIRRLFYDDAFTAYLVEKDFPARRFVRNAQGKLVCNISGQAFYMTEYYPGHTIEVYLNRKQLISSAIKLAQLHHLSKGYTGPKYQRLPFKSKKAFNSLEKIKIAICRKDYQDEFDMMVLEIIQRKADFIIRQPFEKLPFLLEKRIMNHGDYHARNIVFDSHNKVVAILDFEYCVDIPRIWDIALAISWLTKENNTEAFCGPHRIDDISAFVSAYHSENPLFDDEKTNLTKIIISACFHTTFFLEAYYLSNRSSSLDKPKTVNEWFWWHIHEKELKTLIFDSCIL
jgi:Ser/Thr protein kinase RdoA (MazF antagonist)